MKHNMKKIGLQDFLTHHRVESEPTAALSLQSNTAHKNNFDEESVKDASTEPFMYSPYIPASTSYGDVAELIYSPSKPLATSGEDLDDHLLEGALKNLEYFPQLMKEIESVRQEKMKQLFEQEELRRQTDLEAEKARLLEEQERIKDLEKRKEQQLLDAKKLIADAQIDAMAGKVAAIRDENSQMHRLYFSALNRMYQAKMQSDILRDICLRYENAQALHDSLRVHEKEEVESLVGVRFSDVITATGQAELVALSQMKRELQKNAKLCQTRIQRLQLEKRQLINEKFKPSNSANQVTKEDLMNSIEDLEKQKLDLQEQLKKYQSKSDS